MSNFYYDKEGVQTGPLTSAEMKSLANTGEIVAETLIWKEGSKTKYKASQVKGLLPEAFSIEPESKHGAVELGVQSIQVATGQAVRLLQDLKSVNFQEEITPISQELVGKLSKDIVFWSVTALAVIPLLINTIDKKEYQLTAFALFFASLWGVIFKLLIVKTTIGWGWLLGSMFLTGIVGMRCLLLSYSTIFPESYTTMAFSSSGITSLIGFIFQVGICEEFIKCIPVIAYLGIKRKEANPLGAILVGVFSGLGFAAFENMDYGQRAIISSALLAKKAGIDGVVIGTHDAMVNVMLRSLSLVFCHAVWSGILAYFITTGFSAGSRIIALFLIGLTVSSTLHGLYDWLCAVQATIASFIVAFSYILFYSYLTKLKITLE